MGVSAGVRAIPGGNLANQDCGPDLALRIVIGGLEPGHLEEREHLASVASQVLCEAPIGGLRNVTIEQRGQLATELLGDGDAVFGRKLPGEIFSVDRVDDQALDRVRKAGGALLLDLEQLAAPPEEVAVALPLATVEAVVARPAVDDDRTVELVAEDRSWDVAAPTLSDHEQRDRRSTTGEHPEPGLLGRPGDVPAGLVDADDGSTPDHLDERAIAGLAPTGDALLGPDQRTGRHVELKQQVEQARDLAERDTNAVLEIDGQGEQTRPQLNASGAVSLRALLGVATANPLPTLGAPATLHVKAAHQQLDDARQVDDDLGRKVADVFDGALAVGACIEGHKDLFIDACRGWPVGRRVTPLAPRWFVLIFRLPAITGERSGLTLGGPARLFQFGLESIDFVLLSLKPAAQPIALGLCLPPCAALGTQLHPKLPYPRP